MDFIINNLDIVTEIVIALLLIGYAIFTRQWAILKISVYKLMLSAEKLMVTAEGKDKMNEVFKTVWEKLPKVFKKIVKENTVRQLLQYCYDKAKYNLRDK